jgi:hypothetical protein
MHEDAVIEQFEGLARVLGIEVRYEPISLEEETMNVVGGFCILRGENLLIINSKVRAKDKIRVFAQALSRFILNNIYIRPAIRELLEMASSSEKPIVV